MVTIEKMAGKEKAPGLLIVAKSEAQLFLNPGISSTMLSPPKSRFASKGPWQMC